MSLSKLEDFIFEKISDSKLPGLSAAIVMGNDVVWSKGFGFRDLERGWPATPHTLYGIGSLTKSFTSLAILQLAEQGKLDLDDPVDEYIPFDITPGDESVCIWHLMSHTSGIPALAYAESVIRHSTGAGDHWLPIASLTDMHTFLKGAQSWTLNAPGERWYYLNEGYVLLGEIIEKCAEMPYRDYVTQHILEPLGMSRTFFDLEQLKQDQDAAVPYIVTRDGERIPSHYAHISADGGLISNVEDLARYISMFLNWGEISDGRIISRASLESMETPRIETAVQDGPYGENGYALGLGVLSDFLGHQLISHGGSVGIATAWLGFIPQQRIGIALLANGSGYLLSQMGHYGLAATLGIDPETLPIIAHERALIELEGVYETYKGTMQAQVKRLGSDMLVIEMKTRYNTTSVPLIPDEIGNAQRTFYTLSGNAKIFVEFHLDGERIDLIYERYYFRRTGK